MSCVTLSLNLGSAVIFVVGILVGLLIFGFIDRYDGQLD